MVIIIILHQVAENTLTLIIKNTPHSGTDSRTELNVTMILVICSNSEIPMCSYPMTSR